MTSDTQKDGNICAAGYICLEGTGIYPAESLECRKGSYCLQGEVYPIDCEKGTYNPFTKGEDANACIASPAGFYVDIKGATALSGVCAPGYYCEQGSITSKDISCPEKTFRDLPGGKVADDCGACPAGSFCPSGTIIPKSCPKGHYCITGIVDPAKCPKGTFGPSKRLRAMYECTDCWKGRFCADIGQVSPSGICDPGYHCDIASQTPNPEYDLPADPRHAEGWRCVAGGFCEKGSTYNLPCPSSTFANVVGASDNSVCLPCSARKYCVGTPSNVVTGDCREGYFCPGGGYSPTHSICSIGKICIADSFQEQGCLAGTYVSSQGESACDTCPAGFYCAGGNNTAVFTPCPTGHYCSPGLGAPLPCPEGTYMPIERSQLVSECLPCPTGQYCQGTGNPAPTNPCDPGYFCLESAKVPVPPQNLPYYGICPIGHYCTVGVSDPMPCPMGTYNPSTGLTTEALCTQCTQGYYCPDVGMISGVNAIYICPQGYICPTGTIQPSKTYICTPGHRCPTGSHQETNCLAGEYQDSYGDWVCKTCPKGYFCGVASTTFEGNDCPVGCYCPPGTQTARENKCPPSTYNPLTNAWGIHYCITCPLGYHCPNQEMSVIDNTLLCDPGYFCIGSSITPTPLGTGGNKCTQGHYCVQGATMMAVCPLGKYCAGDLRDSPNGNCTQGYYCLGGAYSPTPNSAPQNGYICPKGAYCPEGAYLPTPCPPGTYNEFEGKWQRSQCLKCDDGMYCAGFGSQIQTGNCDLGYFCVDANASDTTVGHTVPNPPTHRCPIGYKCPGLTGSPTPSADKVECGPLDQHQINPGKSVCDECPAGYECTGTTRVFCDNHQRYESIYCPPNQNVKVSCGAGFYNMVDGSSVIGDCKSCPPGSYCLNTLTDPKLLECPASKYCSGETTSAVGNGTCGPGYYCPSGSGYPIPCPAGKYCPTNGHSDTIGLECDEGYLCIGLAITPNPIDGTLGRICPAGSYCPKGAKAPIDCPHGNYNPLEGKFELSHCQNCTSTFECPLRGMTTPGLSNKCPAEYYCPLNTTQGEHFPCPKGYKCPAGQDAPILCEDTTYNPMPMKSSCDECPDRMYCYNSDPALVTETQRGNQAQYPRECPLGFFCAAGTGNFDDINKKCAIGTYGARTGIYQSSECDPCPPGYYCPARGMVPTDINTTVLCDPGYICLGQAVLSNPTDGGTGRLCLPGYYCHTGDVVDRPCPPGTYAEDTASGMSIEAVACKPCPAGRYCPFRGKVKSYYNNFAGNNYQCAAGFVCLTRSVTAYPYYENTTNTMGYYCPAGYKCPAGTLVGTEIKCNTGEWQPYVAQGTCIISPTGRMSEATGNAHALITDLSDCPKGKYCDAGTEIATNAAKAHLCPIGTYSDRVNLEASTECYPCDPGEYCVAGSILPTDYCSAGYACPKGATTPTPSGTFSWGNIFTPGKCPIGHYCEIGSKKPKPCPTGSYMTSNQSSNPQCTDCPYTYVCDELARDTYPTKKCANGYVCIIRATNSKPIDGTTGRLCNKGKYCRAGVETNCAGGTYEPRYGSDTCQICPKGYFCPEGAIIPIICPIAHFCVTQRPSAVPCPNGSYTGSTGIQSAAQCRQCTTGYYCQLGVIVGRCDSGFYCKTGAGRPDPPDMECPIGHYCDKTHSSVLPVICPTGKVRTTVGGTDVNSCSNCPAGEYCIEGLTFGYDCPKGHYCPTLSNLPTPCILGTYRNSVRASDPAHCLHCDPGHYCNATGIPDQAYFACLPGKYCLAGFHSNGSLIEPIKCPKGTYHNTLGAGKIQDCFECTGGSYCLIGTITPQACKEGTYCPKGSFEEKNCTEGHYCPHGTEFPIICPEAYYCPMSTAYPIKCESGYYCPNGTVAPIICPPGTMGSNNLHNVDVNTGCSHCGPGYYSAINDETIDENGAVVTNVVEEFGIETPRCKICPPGYVCLGVTTKRYPTDIDDHRGYECPRGYYCPEGSYQPTPCPKGTFNNFMKQSSLQDCNKCDIDSYSYLVAQRGCLPCSRTATAELGSKQCKCKGQNRVFQFSTGACLCKPNYESVTEGVGDDADSNCIPIVYDACPDNTIRGPEGNCISTTNCPKCPNNKGRRDPGVGICRCETVQDVEEICDLDCRSVALKVTLTVKLNYLVLDPVTGSTSTVDLVEAQNVVGDAKFQEGMTHSVTSLSVGQGGGFSANYQPAPVIVKEHRRALREEFGINRERFLATSNDGGIDSPVICLDLGATIIFPVSGTHYPLYLKDHLANSQPDFDYGAFTDLESRITTTSEAIDSFVFTFTQVGVFVFGDAADNEQITVIGVMEKNEKCSDPDKYIQPITYDSLLKLGVTKRENIQESPNWTFILIMFLMMIVGIPLLIWLITFLHNEHGKKQTLSQIQFSHFMKKKSKKGAEATQNEISEDIVGLSDDESQGIEELDLFSATRFMKQKVDPNTTERPKPKVQLQVEKEEEGEINPELFNEIYRELHHHAEYMKKQFTLKHKQDHKSLIILYQEVMGLEEAMEGNLINITKSMGVKQVRKVFKNKGVTVREGGEELANKLLAYDQNALETESDEEDERRAEKIVDEVMIEDETAFNQVIEGTDKKKKVFLLTLGEEQKNIYELFRKRVENLSNLEKNEKEELLKEFDKQMISINKLLIIEEEKQDADLNEKINERRLRRTKLKEKLQGLQIKESNAKRQFAHEVSLINSDRIKLEREIDQDFEDSKQRGLNRINQKKKDKLEKYETEFKEKMINLNSQKKIGKLLDKYQSDVQKLAKTLDNENKEQINQLIGQLEERRQLRLANIKSKVAEKLNTLDAGKSGQVFVLAEQQDKLTKHLKDTEMEKTIKEVKEYDQYNAEKEELEIENLVLDNQNTKDELELQQEKELVVLDTELREEEKLENLTIDDEKSVLEVKLRKQFYESEKKRQALKDKVKITKDVEEQERLIKEIREFEQMMGIKLNAERDKLLSSIQDRLSARKQKRRTKEGEIIDKFEGEITRGRLESNLKEMNLKSKLREERLHRLIGATIEQLSSEEVPFAIDKIIEEEHITELSDHLQTQFQQKAELLKVQINNLLNQKLSELGELKEGFEVKYKRQKLMLDTGIIGAVENDRKMVDIKRLETDKLRDMELRYTEKQNQMEEQIIKNMENMHAKQLIKLKQDQYAQKRDLLKQYVGDDLLERALAGEQLWMEGEINKYKLKLQSDNTDKLREINSRKLKINDILLNNQEKIAKLDIQAKKLLEEQENRDRKRREKLKHDIEGLRNNHETELLSKVITEEEKIILIEQHNKDLKKLGEAMDKERERQAAMLKRKLEDKLRESDSLKRIKDQQLAMYRQDRKTNLDSKVNEIQREMFFDNKARKKEQKKDPFDMYLLYIYIYIYIDWRIVLNLRKYYLRSQRRSKVWKNC